MRKSFGVLLAVASLLPMVVMAAPAGAAGGTSCSSFTGAFKISPPLPVASSKATVKNATITIKGAKVSGCKGGGVTGGTANLSLKYGVPYNCAMQIKQAPAHISGSLIITWNTKTTTTIKLALASIKGKLTSLNSSGPVTAGTFKGSKFTGQSIYAIAPGSCGTKPFGAGTFKNVGAATIK